MIVHVCVRAHAYAQHLTRDCVTAGGGQVFQPSLRDKHTVGGVVTENHSLMTGAA